jgi:hypothetical protein
VGAKEDPGHTRGLIAIQESKQKRREGRLPAIPTRVWLWALTVFVAWAIFYWKKTQNEIESQKAVLFAKQRGVAAELGSKFDPLRQRIEEWAVAAAGAYADDLVAPELKNWDFATRPGIYLRLRLSDAASPQKMRKAANDSLRDGFTACLFRVPNAEPTSGPPCKASHDCAPGTFCNEEDHCLPPAQPYNMRTAYHGTRVLSDDWTVRLRTASDDMSMRLLEREFDSAVKDDIPLVIELLTRAEFFLLVLDEDPGGALPQGQPPLESIQGMPHSARVNLFGLKPGMDKPLLRLRRDVAAQFLTAGAFDEDAGAPTLGSAPTDPGIVSTQQRQVNSCQLALQVRAAVGR